MHPLPTFLPPRPSGFRPRKGRGLHLDSGKMPKRKRSYSPREGSGLYRDMRPEYKVAIDVTAPVRGAGCIRLDPTSEKDAKLRLQPP